MDEINEKNKKRKEKILGALFLSCVTGAGLMFGFLTTLGMAKRKDENMFAKGILPTKEISESGVSIATRALGRATIYSISGFSLFCFVVWKAMNVKNLEEFRQKVGSWLPRLTKQNQEGRTEFSSLRDLLQYIIDEDKKTKNK